jgi:hypothetical protein
LSHGKCSFIRMYINAYLKHDFHKRILRSNINYVEPQGQPPPPPKEKLWVHTCLEMWINGQAHAFIMNGQIDIACSFQFLSRRFYLLCISSRRCELFEVFPLDRPYSSK